MVKVSTAQLQQNLAGVEYPANKIDLIRVAEEKGADEKVLWALKKVPNQQYATAQDLKQAINESDN
jgi:hypothetical protein